MLFNSFQFLVFLPCVIILYYLLPHKLRWALLLVASYYFYMVWKPEYIILIIISTLVDYFAGLAMYKQENKKKRKALLMASLFANLGILFIFKYFDFFNAQLGEFYNAISNREYPIAALKLILPMGISFYTFQTLSYTIDVYRGDRKAERHFGYFALYVTYFPQLVAGPIERSTHLLPQLKQKHKFDYDSFISSILRICWGLFKKVVIADRIAVIVNTIYNDVHSYEGVYFIIGTLAFAIQIYCDFSAYSDIAIGSAKLMGIDLMENFKMPYFSKSISEFWSRWHISLSTWFRDYLYIPLGGKRVSRRWKYYRNLLIVFLVSGFWHGANWTFIIWGFLHGMYQIIERLFENINSKVKGKKFYFEIPSEIKTVVTFVIVLFAWVFFRANTLADAQYIIVNTNFANLHSVFSTQALFNLGLDNKDFWLLVVSIIVLTLTDYYKYKFNKVQMVESRLKQNIMIVVSIVIILIFGYYGAYEASEFIYFQF